MPKLLKKHRRALKEIYEEFISPDCLDDKQLLDLVNNYLNEKLQEFDKYFDMLYQTRKFDLCSKLRLELVIQEIREFNDDSNDLTLLAIRQVFEGFKIEKKAAQDPVKQPMIQENQQQDFQDCESEKSQTKKIQAQDIAQESLSEEKSKVNSATRKNKKKKKFRQKNNNKAESVCDLLCENKNTKHIIVCVMQSDEIECKLTAKDNKQIKNYEKIGQNFYHSIYFLENSQFQSGFLVENQNQFFGLTSSKKRKVLLRDHFQLFGSLHMHNVSVNTYPSVIKRNIFSVFLKLCDWKKANKLTDDNLLLHIRSLVRILKVHYPWDDFTNVGLEQLRNQLANNNTSKFFILFWFQIFGPRSQQYLVSNNLLPGATGLLQKFRKQTQKFKDQPIYSEFMTYLKRVQFYSALNRRDEKYAESLFFDILNDEQTKQFQLFKLICYIHPCFFQNQNGAVLAKNVDDQSQLTLNAVQYFILQMMQLEKRFGQYPYINPEEKSHLIMLKLKQLGDYISKTQFVNYRQDAQSNQKYRLLIENHRFCLNSVFFLHGNIQKQLFVPSKNNSLQMYKLYKKYFYKFHEINLYFEQNLNNFLLSPFQSDKNKLFDLIALASIGEKIEQQFKIIQKLLQNYKIDEPLLQKIVSLLNEDQYHYPRIIQILSMYYQRGPRRLQFAQINVPLMLQKIKLKNNHFKIIQQLLQLLTIQHTKKHHQKTSAVYHLKLALKCKSIDIKQLYYKRILYQVAEDLHSKLDEVYSELHQKIPKIMEFSEYEEKVYLKVVYSLKNFRYHLNSDQIFRIMQEHPNKLTYQKQYYEQNLKEGLKVIESRLKDKRLFYEQLENLKKTLPHYKNLISPYFDIERCLLNIQQELNEFEQKSQIIKQLLSPYKRFQKEVEEVTNFKNKLNSLNLKEAMVPQEQLVQLYQLAIKISCLKKTKYWECQDAQSIANLFQVIIQDGIQKIGDFCQIYQKAMQNLRKQIAIFVERDMSFQQFNANFSKQENISKVLSTCLQQSQAKSLDLLGTALKKANIEYLNRCLQELQNLNKFLQLTDYYKRVKQVLLQKTISTILKQPANKKVKQILDQASSAEEYLSNVFDIDKGDETFSRLEKDAAYNVINQTVKYEQLYTYFVTENISKQITQQILEYLDDIESTSLGIEAIRDYECIIEYFQHIKSFKSIDDLIKYLKKSKEKTIYLSLCLQNCFSMRSQFQQIIWKAKNRQLSFKCEIQQIFRASTFYCRCQPQVKIQIVLDNQSLNKKSNDNTSITITYKQMHLFKEKSLLIIRDMKKAQKESIAVNDTISLLQKFQIFFALVEKIHKELVTLGNYGFNIELLSYKIRIQKGQYESIVHLQSNLCSEQKKWIQFIKKMYTRSYFLTHYIGPQLNNFIKIFEKQEYLPAFERILKLDRQKFGRISNLGQDYKPNIERFRLAQDYYEKVSCLERAFETIDINQNEKPAQNKIIIIKCNPCDTYSALLTPKTKEKQQQQQKRYQLAQSTQVLFCQQDTTCQEIQIFMYRALIYWSKRHYIIACNNLSQDVKLYFSDLLIDLNKKRKQEFSKANLCFVVNVYDKIIGLLTKPKQFNHERKQIFEKQSRELSKEMVNHISRSMVVESSRAGLGKTFRVERQTKQTNKQLVYFPICGNIKFQNLSKRLKLILKTHDQFALLIQIGHVQNKQKLQVFLAQMVLFRSFYYQQYIFLPPKTEVYIQIENIFEPLESKQNKKVYHIIEMLKNQKQVISIQKFETADLVFDLQNFQQKFSLIYLQLIRTGAILKEELSYKYTYKQNEIKFKAPHIQKCRQNIHYFFVGWFHKKRQDPTFLIYKSFMRMIFNAFKAFSDSPHLHKMEFQGLAEHYKVLRLQEVRKSFLDICIQNILEFLEESITTNDFSDNKNREFQRKFQDKIKEISLLIVPNADYEGYQFVYLDQKKVNLPIKSLLIKSDTQLNKKLRRVQDQNTIHQLFKETALNSLDKELIFKLCDIMYHISNNKRFETNFVRNQHLSIQKLYEKVPKLKFYKITIDNFYKMCLITLRAFSGVPSIIMGESGVGKTALIQFLVNQIFQDKLLVYNVHAGIHQNEIARWVQQIKGQLEVLKAQNKRLWVFFDEFNTSDQLSYFKEIILDRRFMGNKLPDSIIFLAACNPYRYQKQRKINSGLAIQEKAGAARQLAFKVKPPCLSMIQIMWDYQQLKKEQIKQYVQSMIDQVQFSQKKRLSKAVVQAHEYFKDNVQISSVSLRDVTRFRELYNWFLVHMPLQQLKKKNSHLALQKREQINNYKLARDDRAVILSFCFCYSLRIQNRKYRVDFLNKVEDTLRLQKNLMITVLQNEQIDYINRLKYSQEKIAYNAALMENLFATLICLMNRIPILIIGNPGSSKSISIKMLDSNLKGINSQSQFCKNLAAINLLNFQGSQSSTSEGVQKIYEKAELKRQQQQKNRYPKDKKSKVIQVILFDEIGLAEKSVHNPLKVLHSKLQTHKKDLGFIGISNYQLDAAKMSRFLVLAHANPDKNEIKDTAVKIHRSYFPENSKYEQKFKKLGQYYYSFIEKWNKSGQNRSNFFGLRDFYSYIKQICLQMQKKQFNMVNLDKIILKSIQTNFDGQPNSIELFCEIAQIKDELQQINPIDLVINNISNVQSRCLMLIIKNEALIPMINDSIVIKGQKRDVVCIYGSTFEADKQSEEYNLQITSKIISYISRGTILVFKDINNSIQTSLYDLFNKSFSHRNNIKTCRIAVGANSNPKCTVHQNFNAIVYVQEEMVKNLDLPFINRLQKHELNIMKMIQTQDYQTLQQIKSWIKKITHKQADIKLKDHNFFINSSQQALVTLIFKHRAAKNAIQEVKKDLLRNRTIDFEIVLKEKGYDLRQEVQNLSKDILPFNLNKNDMIIFTYDQFSNAFGEMEENITKSYPIRLGELKAEKDLRTQLLFALGNQNFNKIEIFVNYQHEYMHLNYLLFVARQIKSQIQIDKQIVIVIQLHRFTFIKEKTEGINISYLHKYEQYFVQDISHSFNLQNLLELQTFFQVYHKMNLSQKLQIHHLQALKLIKFKCQQMRANELAIQAFQEAAEMLTSNPYYKDQIEFIISKHLKSTKVDLKQLQTINQIVLYSSNIYQALQKYVTNFVQQIIVHFLINIISEGLLIQPKLVIKLLDKSAHQDVTRNFFPTLQKVYNHCFIQNCQNFQKQLAMKKQTKISRLIQNNQAKLPFFLSIFPQSFKDFSMIFKMGNQQNIESMLQQIKFKAYVQIQQKTQLQNKLEGVRSKFQNTKLIKNYRDSEQLSCQNAYFYDFFMFNLEISKITLNASQQIQIFEFFNNLLNYLSYKTQEKIILFVLNRTFTENLINLLTSLFKSFNSSKFAKSIIEDVQQQQCIVNLLIKIAEKALQKACSLIKLQNQSIWHFQEQMDQFIKFIRVIYRKMKLFDKNFKELVNLKIDSQYDSIYKFIQFLNSLKKHEKAQTQEYMLSLFLTQNQNPGQSLNYRIFKFASSYLIKESNQMINQQIIDYLSLFVWPLWFQKLEDFPQQRQQSIQRFIDLCNKYTLFANNSTYFFNCLFQELQMDDFKQMYQKMKQLDQKNQIKSQWINFKNNFSISFGNYLQGIFSRNQHEETQISHFLSDQQDLFTEFCQMKEIKNNCTGVFILQFLKFYGKMYLGLLEKDENIELLVKVDSILCQNNQQIRHLRVFLLKQLYQVDKDFSKIKHQYVERHQKCKWIKILADYIEQKRIQLFLPPQMEDRDENYLKLLKDFQNSKFQDTHMYHQIIKIAFHNGNPWNVYELLNFCMLKFYRRQCPQETIRILLAELDARQDVGQTRFQLIYILLRAYLSHQISQKFIYNQDEFKQQIVFFNYFNLIAAGKGLKIPFNNMFFDQEGLLPRDYAEWLNQRYLIGTIHHPAARRVEFILQRHKLNMQGNSYTICSNTCDYIGPVGGTFYGKNDGCAHPLNNANCPFCGGILGAHAYNVLTNADKGARVIDPKDVSNEKLRINAKKSVQILYNQNKMPLELTGYQYSNQVLYLNEYAQMIRQFDGICFDRMKQNGDMLTYKLLQFLTYLTWYFLCELQQISNDQCLAIWRKTKRETINFLYEACMFYWLDIRKCLKIDSTDDFIVWNLGLAKQIQQFYNLYETQKIDIQLKKAQVRDHFQQHFEEVFSVCYEKQKQALINQSRNFEQKNKTDLIKQIGNLQEHQAEFKNIAMFKIIKSNPCYEDMKTNYKNTIIKSYPILAYIIQNPEIAKRLYNYKQIFVFLSALQQFVDAKLKRHQSQQSLKDMLFHSKEADDLLRNLETFIDCWNSLAKDKFQLKIDCHSQKVLGNLPEIKADSPLRMFLMDRKTANNEHAERLLAFVEIASRQYNERAQTIQRLIVSSYPYYNDIQVFSKVLLNPTFILNNFSQLVEFPLKRLHQLVDLYSSQSVKYGETKAHYSLQNIQRVLIKQFIGCKYLITEKDKFKYITYIGQKSYFISELRDRDDQKTLQQIGLKQKVLNYFNNLQKSNRNSFEKDVKMIQSSLQQIIAFYMNIRDKDKMSKQTIAQFINNYGLKGIVLCLRESPLDQIINSCLADFYEFVQYYSFEGVEHLLDPIYNKEFDEKDKQRIKKLVLKLKNSDGKSIPIYNDFKTALYRFTGRILALTISHEDNKLADYLCEQAYWPKSFQGDEAMKELAKCLDNMPLSKVGSLLKEVPYKNSQQIKNIPKPKEEKINPPLQSPAQANKAKKKDKKIKLDDS